MSIERQGFVGVAAARVFVFIEPCSRESILEIFIFLKIFPFVCTIQIFRLPL
jgi:hypothetical protein